jgi:methylenetetrahydrofolate reductase (NADPH)
LKTFSEALRSRGFVVTADLALDRGTDAADVRRQARLLGPLVDAVAVPDAHDGRLQMSGQAAASILLAEGVDPLVHLTGRDRNRIALENDLLGLGVLGVSSLLLTRGEQLPQDYKPPTRQVLELSGADLVTAAVQLGEDESVPGVPGFCVGTAATVFTPKAVWKPKALLERVDAGVAFIQTQPCFNMKALERYMAHLVEARLTWRCAVVVSLAVLHDVATAQALAQGLHGAAFPPRLLQRMAQASNPEQEGLQICAERIPKVREIPGVSGVNLTTGGPPELLVEALRLAGLAEDA